MFEIRVIPGKLQFATDFQILEAIDIGQVQFQEVSVILRKKIPRIKENSMERSGNGAIRTLSQPSKPKREITKITVKTQREHMVNRVSSYFPKGGHSATQTELKQYENL